MVEHPQRIAILASGPSIHHFWCNSAAKNYNTVIGVNSVCEYFHTDWACIVDKPMVDNFVSRKFILPDIGFVTVKAWKEHSALLGRQFREIPGRFVGCHWSFCNALFFANAMQISKDFRIDIYGFDCELDTPDCGGVHSNHSADRFSRELVWIRAAWRNNNLVRSKIKPNVLDWLTGKTKNLEL